MTESRDEFRDRLKVVFWKPLKGTRLTVGDFNAAAEAVYAQAIRDLLDHIGGMTIHDDVGGSESTDKMLRDFAAERGINFGEE